MTEATEDEPSITELCCPCIKKKMKKKKISILIQLLQFIFAWAKTFMLLLTPPFLTSFLFKFVSKSSFIIQVRQFPVSSLFILAHTPSSSSVVVVVFLQ